MGSADLHLHTAHTDGLPTVAELLDYVEGHTDLDVIAITDHDEHRAAAEAQELAARRHYRFEVIPGIEVTTAAGHLLALFVDGPIAPLRPLARTIALVQERGGLCVLPHPFSWLTFSVSQRSLQRLLADPSGPRPAGVEVANPSLAARLTAARAGALRRRYGLAPTGGSDAHFLGDVGGAYTAFPGRTAAELRQAILTGQTQGLLRPRGQGRRPSLGELARQSWRAYVSKPSLPAALWRRYLGARRP